MVNATFLEDYPLYRKIECPQPEYITRLPKININMHCSICKDTRTFFPVKRYYMRNNSLIDIDKSRVGYDIEIN